MPCLEKSSGFWCWKPELLAISTAGWVAGVGWGARGSPAAPSPPSFSSQSQ